VANFPFRGAANQKNAASAFIAKVIGVCIWFSTQTLRLLWRMVTICDACWSLLKVFS